MAFERGKKTELRGGGNESLIDWIAVLKKTFSDAAFNPDKDFYEFTVDVRKHPISVADLQELLKLPVEIGLVERAGKLVITSGTESGLPFPDQLSLAFFKMTKLSAHTHPLNKVLYTPSCYPSPGDLESAAHGIRAAHVLIHSHGLLVFQRPVFDPTRQVPLSKETSNDYRLQMFWRFLERYGIDVHDWKRGEAQLASLPRQKTLEIQEAYARETGSVVLEAGWHEHDKIAKILKIINLKS